MTRWDLVYKWADPETQSIVDAVTSALENCDRKLTEALAAPRAEGLPSEAEDWYELDRRILASEQRIVLLEAVIREAVAHIEGFMANGPQQPAGGWYGAQSWLAELPSRLRPSDERQPGDSDAR